MGIKAEVVTFLRIYFFLSLPDNMIFFMKSGEIGGKNKTDGGGKRCLDPEGGKH